LIAFHTTCKKHQYQKSSGGSIAESGNFTHPHKGEGTNDDVRQVDIFQSIPAATAPVAPTPGAEVEPVEGRHGPHGLQEAQQAQGEEALDEVVEPTFGFVGAKLVIGIEVVQVATHRIGDGAYRIQPHVDDGIGHEAQDKDGEDEGEYGQADPGDAAGDPAAPLQPLELVLEAARRALPVVPVSHGLGDAPGLEAALVHVFLRALASARADEPVVGILADVPDARAAPEEGGRAVARVFERGRHHLQADTAGPRLVSAPGFRVVGWTVCRRGGPRRRSGIVSQVGAAGRGTSALVQIPRRRHEGAEVGYLANLVRAARVVPGTVEEGSRERRGPLCKNIRICTLGS